MEEAGRLYNSGDYKKAAKAFSGVIKNEPTALAYYNRALCYYNMRKWKKAVRDCESALSCYPSRSLRDAVDALYDDASRRRQDQLDRRANLWTNIAAGVAVGAVVTGTTTGALIQSAGEIHDDNGRVKLATKGMLIAIKTDERVRPNDKLYVLKSRSLESDNNFSD